MKDIIEHIYEMQKRLDQYRLPDNIVVHMDDLLQLLRTLRKGGYRVYRVRDEDEKRNYFMALIFIADRPRYHRIILDQSEDATPGTCIIFDNPTSGGLGQFRLTRMESPVIDDSNTAWRIGWDPYMQFDPMLPRVYRVERRDE